MSHLTPSSSVPVMPLQFVCFSCPKTGLKPLGVFLLFCLCLASGLFAGGWASVLLPPWACRGCSRRLGAGCRVVAPNGVALGFGFELKWASVSILAQAISWRYCTSRVWKVCCLRKGRKKSFTTRHCAQTAPN